MAEFTIGVVVHPTRAVGESLDTLASWAAAQGIAVLGRAADADRLPGLPTAPDDEFAATVSGVVSLGGDGTMLGAMRLVAERPVPVLGVNHGTLGFLVEVPPDRLPEALARLVDGRFSVEARGGLRVSAGSPAVAFNDVVLRRHGGISVDLGINDERYGYYRCDALVVATPTGSTAYSYAAGGPVLSPSLAATVVTPVAPMSGIARSVVFGSDDVVSLHLAPESAPVDLDVDGVPAGAVADTVTVTVLASPAQVVRLDSDVHARRSRVRLSLLDLPLRPDQLRELVPPDLRHRLP